MLLSASHQEHFKFQINLSLMVGLCNTADAMEMMILSILSPALHCHWHITQVQQATLTTVVFFGEGFLNVFHCKILFK